MADLCPNCGGQLIASETVSFYYIVTDARPELYSAERITGSRGQSPAEWSVSCANSCATGSGMSLDIAGEVFIEQVKAASPWKEVENA